MKAFGRYSIIMAVCLSALAGYVDAIGFLQLGGYFVSFMSGNSTRFVVSYINEDNPHVILIATILLFFVLGAILGTLLSHRVKSNNQSFLLLFVSGLLFSASLCGEYGLGYIAVMFMTMAMGAENITFQRDGDIAVGLTYMTGTLVKLGQRIAFAILGKDNLGWVPYLLLWAGLVSGGAAGVVSFKLMGLHSLWIATIWATALSCLIRQGEPNNL
jgi:uncharacterized membrane protein YoaK (UPF0700 family)